MDLEMSSSFPTWSSSTKSEPLLLHSSLWVSGTWVSWKLVFLLGDINILTKSKALPHEILFPAPPHKRLHVKSSIFSWYFSTCSYLKLGTSFAVHDNKMMHSKRKMNGKFTEAQFHWLNYSKIKPNKTHSSLKHEAEKHDFSCRKLTMNVKNLHWF